MLLKTNVLQSGAAAGNRVPGSLPSLLCGLALCAGEPAVPAAGFVVLELEKSAVATGISPGGWHLARGDGMLSPAGSGSFTPESIAATANKRGGIGGTGYRDGQHRGLFT
jgi:hypothetical protein